ncbi:MAG: delta-lactam-biosynthetic de-N-acetylase [Eubacteriaceae bacterium]|nr:delta-lactam-biosynthetic de-N-acetylase [Eubacteriaceae bacterium]
MFIEINKVKLKKLGTGMLAFALTFAVLASVKSYRSEHGYPAGDVAVSTENWGLSFQQEGSPPIGNATSQQLGEVNAFYCGNPEEKVLYLTFDAGFENGCTAQILDVLKEENVPAAFFLVGTYIKGNPELVRRMVDENHIVGNHTMNHPDMSAISDKDAFSDELTQVEEIYRDVTGKEMLKYYRPPQGKFSFDNLSQAKELGYTTVFWSLAYVDWYVDQQPTREEAFEKLIPRTHNGAIILLHSTSKTNTKILGELIQKWKSEGYEFKSVTDLKPLS